MKKILKFYFFLLFFHLNTEAQPYQSIFGRENTTWTFHWFNMDTEGYMEYKYQKDTFYNNKIYKKICLDQTPSTNIYSGLFREDTLSGKVWWRSLDPYALDTSESLLFDFNLLPGDSFDISCMVTSSLPVLYRHVDSIKYFGGLKYIYFDLKFDDTGDPGDDVILAPNEPITLIEGIGCNMGPFWKQSFGILRGQYLMCSKKDGVRTSFENVRYAGLCPELTTIDKVDLEQTKIIVYPNPAYDFIAFQYEPVLELESVKIINLSGRVLHNIRHKKGSKISITDLNNGYYILEIITRDQKIIHESFTVHR